MPAPVEPDPPPRKLTFKAAEFKRENPPESAPSSSANDPLELLRLNRQREIAQGFDKPPPGPPKKMSRRHRDYLIVLAAGNLVLGGLLFVLNNAFGFVCLIAMMALFSAALTWIMLFIFEDY